MVELVKEWEVFSSEVAETYDQELVTPFKATSRISGEDLMLSVGLEGEEYCEIGEVQVWVYDSGASTPKSRCRLSVRVLFALQTVGAFLS